jgi:predicted transcriptional regulator
MGDLRIEDDLSVVVNDERIVLGDLRGKALKADSRSPVEDVMNPGPSTYRPNVSVSQMAQHMVNSGARKVLVSDADGRLLGWLTFHDVLEALDRQHSAQS